MRYFNEHSGYSSKPYIVEKSNDDDTKFTLRPMMALRKGDEFDKSYDYIVSHETPIRISKRINGKFYKVGKTMNSHVFTESERPLFF